MELQGNIFFDIFNLFAPVLNLKRVEGGNNFNRATATSQPEHEVKATTIGDVVISQRSAVFKLFSSKNHALLVRRYAFFVLDDLLDLLNHGLI